MRVQIVHYSRFSDEKEIVGQLWSTGDAPVKAQWGEDSDLVREPLEERGIRVRGRTFTMADGERFLDALILAYSQSSGLVIEKVRDVVELEEDEDEIDLKKGGGRRKRKIKRDKSGRFAGGEAAPAAKKEEKKGREKAAPKEDTTAKKKAVDAKIKSIEKRATVDKKKRDAARKEADKAAPKLQVFTNHREAAVSGKKSTTPVGKADTSKQQKVDIDAGELRNWTDKLPKGMKEETWQGHFDGHPDPKEAAKRGLPVGKPSAERKEAVHDPIADHFSAHVKPVAPGVQKIAIVTMGGPASGKSSSLRGLTVRNKATDKLEGMVEVEPDAIKGMMPEFRTATGGDTPSDPRTPTYEKAAFMAHEESGYIAKRIRDKAVADGKNLLIDGTGANADAYRDMITELKEKGYKVSVRMTTVPVEVAKVRNVERAQKNGRLVPPKFVQGAYEKIPKNTWKVAAVADDFELHDSNRPRGSPTKVYSAAAGKQTVHDQGFYDQFRQENGGPRADVTLRYVRVGEQIMAQPPKLPEVNPEDFAPIIDLEQFSRDMQEGLWAADDEAKEFRKAVEKGTAGPVFDIEEGILEGLDPDLGDDALLP
jgi:predicted ABC-type ATPase